MDNLDHLLAEAERVFRDKHKAAVWLSKQRAAFDGNTALELARDESGYRRVMAELKRLENGFGC